VDCDLINNRNSTVMNLGTCTVNVLCQSYVKRYVAAAFIIEYNLSIKFKNHCFSDIYLYYILLGFHVKK
jgi:hypothetical protein